MMTEKAEVSGHLEGAETDLVTVRHRVRASVVRCQ